MGKTDDLGDRMKVYEDAFRHHLPPNLPIVVRVDGRHFHTWTRRAKCEKPYDLYLMDVMDETASAMCRDMQNARMAYVQSDEISVILKRPDFDSQDWFDGGQQKIASVSASVATGAFAKACHDHVMPHVRDWAIPEFDARCFVLPSDEEVLNYFIWRQRDWERNSVQMLARSLYSHREVDGKNIAAMHDLIHAKGQNWNNLATSMKRGRCIVRKRVREHVKNAKFEGDVDRSRWAVDEDIPVFTKDREYVLRRLQARTNDKPGEG